MEVDESVAVPDAGRLGGVGSEATHEFIRYFFASALALIVDIGLLWLLTSVVGMHYLLSAALSFSCGVVIIYLLSITWVFSARRVTNPLSEFLLFLAIGVVGLVLNEAALWVLTGMFGLFYLAAKIVSVAIVFFWNFGARKMALFSHE